MDKKHIIIAVVSTLALTLAAVFLYNKSKAPAKPIVKEASAGGK